MKYKAGDKVLLKAVYTVDTVDERDSERPYVIMDRSGIRIGRYSEEDLSPAVIDPEEATEQFAKDLDNGFYDEKTGDEWVDDVVKEMKDKEMHIPDIEYTAEDLGIGDKVYHNGSYIDREVSEASKRFIDKINATGNPGYPQYQATDTPLKEYTADTDAIVKGRERDATDEITQELLNSDKIHYNYGYTDGYEEAKTEFFENRYQEGLQDAWELVGKIALMANSELEPIFHEFGLLNILGNYTATQALEKIKAYERERRKIKVGDIVAVRCKHDSTNTLDLVMDVDSDEGLWAFDNNECASLITPYEYIGDDAYLEVTRTGRTYNIQSILDQLKE